MRLLVWLLAMALAGMVGLIAVVAFQRELPPVPELEVLREEAPPTVGPTPTPLPSPPPQPTQLALELIQRNTTIIEATAPRGHGPLIQVSRGTGMVVRLLPDGYVILTAGHVLDSGTTVRARRVEARVWCEGRMISDYESSDVAVLYCHFGEASGLPRLSLPTLLTGARDYDGRPVLFRCHFDDAPRLGKVLGQVLSSTGQPMLVTDIPAEPGCSGSALLDTEGNLIGVVVGSDRERGTALAAVLPQGLNP
ncbi:MAG: serine protease [Dehalococcoidia bacterium]|jgi:S1-C subfamily serine protease|nr:serine protease [Dehalococcoidia bacterium]MDW8008847.1 serine protease [Chloroflexota bacterium]